MKSDSSFDRKNTATAKISKSKGEELGPFDWQMLAPAPVIGLDEVGRGCLAGPVYAAAVIVPQFSISRLANAGVTDSKLVTEKKRGVLADLIQETCFFGLGWASSDEIDEINILQATFLSMKRALVDLESRLSIQTERLQKLGAISPFGLFPGHLLIDGNQKIPFRGTPFEQPEFQKWAVLPQTTLIKGDLRALPIAAASIVAKVTRDRLMIAADEEYPAYGFKGHKGYAAAVHRKAIEEHGPTPLHRKTFGGVREFV